MNGNLILIYVEAAYRWIINFNHKILKTEFIMHYGLTFTEGAKSCEDKYEDQQELVLFDL